MRAGRSRPRWRAGGIRRGPLLAKQLRRPNRGRVPIQPMAERATDKWERESLLRVAADWGQLARLAWIPLRLACSRPGCAWAHSHCPNATIVPRGTEDESTMFGNVQNVNVHCPKLHVETHHRERHG
jgi:hypothetical protein